MKHKDDAREALAMLKSLAEKNDITQTAIAGIVGMKKQSVGQMLNGKFDPGFSYVFKFLNAINEISGQKYTLADLVK
jgi:predicted transcriptional regulator